MNQLKIFIIFCLFFMLSSHAWAWTTENHEWENGDTIIWDVPYQTQSTFRNWTTACMPTSGAMIVNFFYAGAHILNFYDIHGNDHPWNPVTVNNSYKTTGQRIFALGIIGGNSGDFSLSTYLENYPKNGIPQYYCTSSGGCSNANYGPLHNERFSWIVNTSGSVTNTDNNTGGYISSLVNYLSKKHLIEINDITSSISSVRNALYIGPVIISVRYNGASHIVVVKGVNDEGNLIINDPWGASVFSYPGNDGNSKIYTVVNNTSINAYNNNHTIGYAYSIDVLDNYQREVSPFSPFNIPVESNIIFNYDASGTENIDYNGDGDYAHIRNGFNYWNSSDAEWNYLYSRPNTYAFPYVRTTQTDKETAAARWTPYLTREGQYEVLVGFFPHSSNSSEITYIVYHKNGENRVTINQKNNDNAFEVRKNIVYKSLGSYAFNKGDQKETGSVKVINTSNVAGDINVDIVKFLYLGEIVPANDSWHGNGSVISYHKKYISSDPGGSYPFGCSKDSVKIHSIDNEKPVAFFQWQTRKNDCQNLRIDAPDLSFIDKMVDITIGHWNRRDKDITFSNILLPFVIGPDNTNFSMSDANWYVVKVAFKNSISTVSLLNVQCTDDSVTSASYQSQQNSYQLLNGGYKWNGTGSVISYIYRELKGMSLPNDFPYGCFKDVTKVHPSSEKPVVFFQWQTWEDSCQELQITAPSLQIREKHVKITIGPWQTRQSDVVFQNITLPFTLSKYNTGLQFEDGNFYTIKIEFQNPVTQIARVYANCPDALLETVSTQLTRLRSSSGPEVPKVSVEDNINPSLSISNPKSGAVILIDKPCEISFVGTDNVGISSFKIEFSIDGGYSYSILKNDLPSDSNRYTWSPSQSTNQGKIRITAYDIAGNHSVEFRSITVKADSNIPENSPPDIPQVNDPGYESSYGVFTLSWKSLENTDYYIVKETFNNNDNEMTVYDRSIQLTKSENGTYYYRVKGVNSNGSGDWGGPVDIIVNITPNKPPTVPHQPTPSNGTIDKKIRSIYFHWFSHDYDKKKDPEFQILLGTNQSQLEIVRDYGVEDACDNSYSHPGPLLHGTTYYWQINVKDDRGAEVSSPVWSFETAQQLSFDSPVYTDKTNEMIPQINNYSLSVGTVDIDQDGDLDIFDVDNTPYDYEPSIWIYKNNGDGSFTHHEETGFPKGLRGAGASWVDYDNDGDQDVIIWFHYTSPKLFKNNGDIRFTESTSNAGLVFSSSNPGLNTCSWGDIENDGDMDLYCSCDEKLFKNNGNGTFTDISNSCGFSEPGDQFPSSSCWVDINKDGQIDLLTVGMNSGIYKNMGESTFEQTTFGGLTPRDYISLSVGDYNNDGLPDIFLSSGGGSSYANTDRLLKNKGNYYFQNVTSVSGIPDSQVSHEATTWLDYDNDGWLDLTAGSNLFRNMGDGTFNKVTGSIGLSLLNSVNGVFAFDINNDGAQDLYYGTINQNQIFINERPARNWVKVKLQGGQTNPNGYGAEIRVSTTEGQYYRFPTTSVGYGEQESPVQHFGVNTSTKVNVRVAWPDGIIDERFDLDVNQEIVIIEGQYQDETPPGNISNLVAVSDSESSVILAWTAPGDDGWFRKAASYECRRYNAPIDITNWDNAYVVSDSPLPLEPGVRQHWKIRDLLPDTLYYFAIKTYDEAGNVSGLSNIGQVRTLLGDKLLAFSATPFGGNQVQLSWKVPNVLISAYDIRYSESWINESNFEQTNTVSNPPLPKYPGNIQFVDIENLKSNTTYYFAIKMILPGSIKSPISNVLSVKTLSPVNNTPIINSAPFYMKRHGYTPLMAGDLNGDSKPDAVFTTSAYIENEHRYRVTVHFSNNGTLNAIPDITISNNSSRFASEQSVAISDLNNDGSDDLIIGFHRNDSSNQGQVFVYLGGTGMNAVADYVISGSHSESRFGQSILGNVDFNNDTIDDLLIYERGQLLFYYGGNSFDTVPDRQISFTDPDTNYVYLSSGDFNGDSRQDLVAQYNYRKLAFFISDENDFVLPPPTLEKPSLYSMYPVIGDFDGNGCDDLAITVSSSNVHILKANAQTDWATAESYTIMVNVARDNANMVSMDINGDGTDDLIVGHGDDQTYYDGVVRVYLGGEHFDNIADKEISLEGYVDFGHYLSALGDLNGDAIDDLLIASEYDDMIVMAGGPIDIKNDIIAPSTVSDLSAISEKVGQATLSWTAPGDDAETGKALQYDIIQTLYKNNFHSIWGTRSITISNIPSPSISGTTETCIVYNLIPGLTYRFILRAWDDAGNLSERSNIAMVEIKTGYEFEKRFSYDDINLTSTGCISNNGLHSGYNGGDINGDGIDDLMLEGGAGCGRVRIFYGNALFEASPDFDISGNDFRTRDLNGVGGCAVNQINGAYPLGDFNNDGINDFYTYYSCYYTEAFYTGSSNLFFVNPSGKLHDDWENFERVGDVNGDGFEDFVALDLKFYSSRYPDKKAGLFLGGSTFKDTPDILLYDAPDFYMLRGIGDFNGDGYDDIAIGMSPSSKYENGVFEYYGDSRVNIYLGSSNMDNNADIVIKPTERELKHAYNPLYACNFGRVIEGIGDWNGDGFDDLAVSASASEETSSDQGIVYVYFGSQSNISGDPDITLFGPPGGNDFGDELYSVGDLNGDHYSDFMVGGLEYVTSERGQVRLIYLGGTNPSTTPIHAIREKNTSINDTFYNREHQLGIDFNNDGKSEIIWEGNEVTSTGTYYLVELNEKDSDNDSIPDIQDPYINHAQPKIPQLQSPASGANRIGIHDLLTWSVEQSEGQDLTYDLYLGLSEEPALYSQGLTINQYDCSNHPLKYNTYYYWKVVVRDSVGQSASSNIQSFITTSPPVPRKPLNLLAESNETGISLGWSLPETGIPVDYVIIERNKTDENIWHVIDSTTNGFSNNYVDTYDIQSNQLYKYRIVFQNVSGRSEYSSEVEVTGYNHPPVIIEPANILLEACVSNQFVVSSDDADGDQVTFQLLDAPAGATINKDSGKFQWTPTGEQIGIQSFIISVLDSFGANNSKRITLTVQDTTPPVIVVPQDISVNSAETPAIIDIGNATASDLVSSIDQIIISNDAPASGFLSGETIVTWYAVDKVGNSASGLQTVIVKNFCLDIDGHGEADALTDGLLIIRFLFGLEGDSLIKSVVKKDSPRSTSEEITNWLNQGISFLDVDDNNKSDALTDGLLIVRFLFGLQGQSLINNAVDTKTGNRVTAQEIETYLNSLMP